MVRFSLSVMQQERGAEETAGESPSQRVPGDALWWIVAGGLSLIAYQIPDWVAGVTTDNPGELMSNGALFLIGALVGYFRPQGQWRWGLAGGLGFAFGDLIQLIADPRFAQWSSSDIWAHVQADAPMWGFHVLPVLAGAYLMGAYRHVT
jgi:hypothetical protein